MNAFKLFALSHSASPRPAFVAVVLAVALTGLVPSELVLAQEPPTATPVETPSPAPTTSPSPAPSPEPSPTPTPGGGDAPAVTITPGLPSGEALAAYNAARTPQVSVVMVASPANGNIAAIEAQAATRRDASSNRRPDKGGGVAMIRFPAGKPASGTGTTRTKTSASSSAQTVAAVVLTYDASNAGSLVWVQPLDGGTLSTIGGDGATYTAADEGFYLTISTDGTATFNFQPPAASGTYQVLTRMDNVKTLLPFLAPDAVP